MSSKSFIKTDDGRRLLEELYKKSAFVYKESLSNMAKRKELQKIQLKLIKITGEKDITYEDIQKGVRNYKKRTAFRKKKLPNDQKQHIALSTITFVTNTTPDENPNSDIQNQIDISENGSTENQHLDRGTILNIFFEMSELLMTLKNVRGKMKNVLETMENLNRKARTCPAVASTSRTTPTIQNKK